LRDSSWYDEDTGAFEGKMALAVAIKHVRDNLANGEVARIIDVRWSGKVQVAQTETRTVIEDKGDE